MLFRTKRKVMRKTLVILDPSKPEEVTEMEVPFPVEVAQPESLDEIREGGVAKVHEILEIRIGKSFTKNGVEKIPVLCEGFSGDTDAKGDRYTVGLLGYFCFTQVTDKETGTKVPRLAFDPNVKFLRPSDLNKSGNQGGGGTTSEVTGDSDDTTAISPDEVGDTGLTKAEIDAAAEALG
jgi:hypothetical protein